MKNTPHINPTADIADTALLPGDPLRAKFVAEHFLTGVSQFNAVRGALGFTGSYKNRRVSVMGTGMGMPAMAIYSHELIAEYGVKNLVRIGSCGAYADDLSVYDIVLAQCASTDSNYPAQFGTPGAVAPAASWRLLYNAYQTAGKLKTQVRVGNVLSSDIFYNDDENAALRWRRMGVLAVEMETAALYLNASRHSADALSILTVSDHIFKKEEISTEERERSFTNMMELALESVLL